jgi:hypothetical protein
MTELRKALNKVPVLRSLFKGSYDIPAEPLTEGFIQLGIEFYCMRANSLKTEHPHSEW